MQKTKTTRLTAGIILIPLFLLFMLVLPLQKASAATTSTGPCAFDNTATTYPAIDTYISSLPSTTAKDIEANAKTKDIMIRSCKCDGTWSLTTEAAVTSCENCQKGSKNCLKNNVIIKDIQKFVDFLSALVGIVVIGSIMVGGIQYALGGDNAEKVGQAKKRISTSLFAFLIFILTFAFLQWLIPGGVF